jgi:ubiquitin carboxyl-terminal hydrolase 48
MRAIIYSIGEVDFFSQESPIFQLQTTFAALQESRMKVFNPEKLVGSLQLRTNEQQDAQECVNFDVHHRSATHRSHRFSKLFITHLDDEFKKQPDLALKHLVSNQVNGSRPVHVLTFS